MAEESKKETGKPTGMWNVVFTDKLPGKKGEKAVYHASTAKTLEKKGIVKLGEEILDYKPKGIKE